MVTGWSPEPTTMPRSVLQRPVTTRPVSRDSTVVKSYNAWFVCYQAGLFYSVPAGLFGAFPRYRGSFHADMICRYPAAV